MKNKYLIALLICTLLSVCLIGCSPVDEEWGNPGSPFIDVKSENVEKIVVIYGLYGKSYTMSDTEKELFIPLLNEIVIYERDESWRGNDGGLGIEFEIHYSEQDKITKVMPIDLYVEIDGKGYRSLHKPCNEVSDFLYRIIFREFHPSSKPFENLQASDLESVVVEESLKEYCLDTDETNALVEMLKNINTYGEAPIIIGQDECQEVFTVNKKDGTSFLVSFSYPDIIIDGTHYVTDWEQARLGEELYESIVQEHFSQVGD